MSYDITAGVNTFMRPQKLRKTLSCLEKAGIEKVIVGDDGKQQREKDNIYAEFENIFEKFDVLNLPFNHGLSATRNEIISKVDTDFFLMLDDDQYVPEDILRATSIFDYMPKLGAVGFPILEQGEKIIFAHDLSLKGNCVIRHMKEEKHEIEIDDVVYSCCFDLIPTASIFKTEVFEYIGWDNNFIIGAEHLDFFLRAKEMDWKFAVCNSMSVVHDPGGNPEFTNFRTGQEIEKSKDYLRSKWNISGVLPETVYYYSEKGTTFSHYLFKPLAKLLLALPSSVVEEFGGSIDSIKNKIQKITR